MRQFYQSISLFIIFLFIVAESTYATHIRAGEITTQRLSGLTYRITIKGYRDVGGVEWGQGTLSFGDGEEITFGVGDWSKRILPEDSETEENTLIIEHTYPSTGLFEISYSEQNRNAGVLNINNGNSVNIPFYIETRILIDPSFGLNGSPVLLVPPIDKGAVGSIFLHNPGAFDREGDSLAYRLVPSQETEDTPVPQFKLPNDPSFGGSRQDSDAPPIFTLDPITGDIVWDAPAVAGEYNFAFVVEEWRKIEGEFFLLGEVTRDMQVLIEETENEPPELQMPLDTCVVAGTLLEQIITATDPDNPLQQVKIESFGGVYELGAEYFSPDQGSPPVFQDQPAEATFQWQTNCELVRERPYTVQFKASDMPEFPPSLIDLQTWNITVVGPAPQLDTAIVRPGRSVELRWQDYTKFCGNAETMQVWRRVDSYDFTPEGCDIGIPEGSGYELIAELPITATTYLDDNNEQGLAIGANYCYRLVAVFPQPAGGESLASEEQCATLAVDVPAITNVDINETSTTEGEIFVRWTKPFEINQILFPPPYSYEVVRAEGYSGNDNRQLVSGRMSENDTVFTDTGLNTQNMVYNYRILLYDGGNNLIDSSSTASSVRLEPFPLFGAIELRWQAEVPWSNNTQEFPIHDIYRDNVNAANPDELVKIASVDVNQNGFFYLDDGGTDGPLSEDIEYCYFVFTRGSYGNPDIIDPLENKSQIICAQPNDTIPPCAPALALETEDCETLLASGQLCNIADYSNTIRWNRNDEGECEDDIRSFNIYFSATGNEGTFELKANIIDTVFIDKNLISFAGCYYVTAVDRSGNESEPSEVVCNDNCPSYELPNAFTPHNGDQFNDVFQAFPCALFVESVKFIVYNRWGKELYNYSSGSENSIYINWDGRTNDGDQVSAGVYYYEAEVRFNVLNPSDAVQKYKGWINVLGSP